MMLGHATFQRQLQFWNLVPLQILGISGNRVLSHDLLIS
jgi:hypothetical protein